MKNKLTLLALALLLPTTSLADEYSIIKPLWGKHYTERNFRGQDWNENYLDSIGAGYRHSSGFGGYAIYANENSVNNPAWYIHGEYMHQLNDYLAVGGALGIRNGYPKKVYNRSKNDFIPSGAGQVEGCYNDYCTLLMIAPNVSVINLKYKF